MMFILFSIFFNFFYGSSLNDNNPCTNDQQIVHTEPLRHRNALYGNTAVHMGRTWRPLTYSDSAHRSDGNTCPNISTLIFLPFSFFRSLAQVSLETACATSKWRQNRGIKCARKTSDGPLTNWAKWPQKNIESKTQNRPRLNVFMTWTD